MVPRNETCPVAVFHVSMISAVPTDYLERSSASMQNDQRVRFRFGHF